MSPRRFPDVQIWLRLQCKVGSMVSDVSGKLTTENTEGTEMKQLSV